MDLGDVELRAIHTPGTDPAHLGYDVAGEGCAIVGELFDRGMPAAVPEPDDADSLARSIARVDALAERRRLGAHN